MLEIGTVKIWCFLMSKVVIHCNIKIFVVVYYHEVKKSRVNGGVISSHAGLIRVGGFKITIS